MSEAVLFPAPLPDLEGKVHGIKSLDPLTVQCDDCLEVFTDPVMILALQKATFSPVLPDVRLCDGCWIARGFTKKHGGSWRPA